MKDKPEIENRSRRKAVKTIVGGVTALAAYNIMPTKWGTPVIEQIFLPAHAATSGEIRIYTGTVDTGGDDLHTYTVTVTGSFVTFLDDNPSQPQENISGSGSLTGTITGSNASTDTSLNLTIDSISDAQITISAVAFETSSGTTVGTLTFTLDRQ